MYRRDIDALKAANLTPTLALRGLAATLRSMQAKEAEAQVSDE